jgi:hypothetical protein
VNNLAAIQPPTEAEEKTEVGLEYYVSMTVDRLLCPGRRTDRENLCQHVGMSHQPEKMGSGNRNCRQGAPELSFSRIGEALIVVIGPPEEREKPKGNVPQGQSAGGVGLF